MHACLRTYTRTHVHPYITTVYQHIHTHPYASIIHIHNTLSYSSIRIHTHPYSSIHIQKHPYTYIRSFFSTYFSIRFASLLFCFSAFSFLFFPFLCFFASLLLHCSASLLFSAFRFSNLNKPQDAQYKYTLNQPQINPKPTLPNIKQL